MLRVVSSAVLLVLVLLAQGCVNITVPQAPLLVGLGQGGNGGPGAQQVPPGAKGVGIKIGGTGVVVVCVLERVAGTVRFDSASSGSLTVIHIKSLTGATLKVEQEHREMLQKAYDSLTEIGEVVLVPLPFDLEAGEQWESTLGDKHVGHLLIPYSLDGKMDPGYAPLLVSHIP